MKRTSKIFALFLAVLMVVAIIPFSAASASFGLLSERRNLLHKKEVL